MHFHFKATMYLCHGNYKCIAVVKRRSEESLENNSLDISQPLPGPMYNGLHNGTAQHNMI